MKKKKVRAANVGIGDNVLLYGAPPSTRNWILQVPYTDAAKGERTELQIEEGKILYADVFRNSFLKDGKRAHPFLDAKTGKPATHLLGAVVYLPFKAKLDLPAPVLMFLAPEQALRLVHSIPKAECFILDAKGKVWQSQGWQDLNRRDKSRLY